MIEPNSGGTFRRNADGSLDLVEPPTGERPCPCRPDEPPVAPVIEVDTTEPPPAVPRTRHSRED